MKYGESVKAVKSGLILGQTALVLIIAIKKTLQE
jgi:hypothetical protein